LRPDPDVLARRIDDKLVLVHLRTDRLYEMNPTATRIWELIGAGHDAAQIQAQIMREFHGPAATIAAEVKGALASMQEENLVSVDDCDGH